MVVECCSTVRKPVTGGVLQGSVVGSMFISINS